MEKLMPPLRSSGALAHGARGLAPTARRFRRFAAIGVLQNIKGDELMFSAPLKISNPKTASGRNQKGFRVQYTKSTLNPQLHLHLAQLQ